MLKSSLFTLLAVLFFVLLLVFATLAFVYVRRLRARTPVPKSEDVGAYVTVLGKLRKRQPMSADEVDYAAQFIADRRHILAYSIPAAIFSLGCFYVFGSLAHLHGATPSERTFLGVIPMITSTNLAIRLIRVARLKGRLQTVREQLQTAT